MVGNPGTGKSHLATALAAQACAKGYRVRFIRTTELVTALIEARDERSFLRLKGQFAKLDLLVLDELGYVPASKVGSELLFDVISTAYERTSLIVTTNLPFESWTEVLGSERLTGSHARPAHAPLPDHRDQGRELPAPRRQGPHEAPSQIRHRNCGRTHSLTLTSHNRTAAVFDHFALPFSIVIHTRSRPAVSLRPRRRSTRTTWRPQRLDSVVATPTQADLSIWFTATTTR